MDRKDLRIRLFNFSVNVLKSLKYLPAQPEFKVIRYQLAKSATSSGANYEEAQAGSSRADFIYKTEISLKEMRESNYWLRIIKATLDCEEEINIDLDSLTNESIELQKILGKIVVKSKANLS